MKDVNVQEAKQISKQNKYKEIHTKAHLNISAGHQRQREDIKNSQEKKDKLNTNEQQYMDKDLSSNHRTRGK